MTDTAMTEVSLRAVEKEDLDFLFMLENTTDIARAGFATAPASRRMLWEYIENYTADIFADKQLRLIVVAEGKAVGAVDISDFDARDRRGFVGIAIAPQYRRRGYGRAALVQLCEYARTTIGMHQLTAVVAVDNTASLALFAACGFKTCGCLRSWVRRGNSYTDARICQRLF
ncbi:MAG: GNAT family N-acetyltransferase [Muribaculaceae bacterium]|nr:GNAT family N-acetyltransferase [Muribaculaceae bacterium]